MRTSLPDNKEPPAPHAAEPRKISLFLSIAFILFVIGIVSAGEYIIYGTLKKQTPAASDEATTTARSDVQMVKLATVPDTFEIIENGVLSPDRNFNHMTTYAISPDGKHVLYKARAGPGYVCVVGNVIGNMYQKIELCQFGTDYTYPVYKASRVVGVDPTPRGCKSVTNKICDPNYLELLEEKIIIGTQEGKPYPAIGRLVVDRQSQHIAYVACVREDHLSLCSGAAKFVVVDGQEGKRYGAINTDISAITFTDSGDIQYIACTELKESCYRGHADAVHVTGSVEQSAGTLSKTPQIIYSADKKYTVHVTSEYTNPSVVLNDRVVAAYGSGHWVSASSIIFSSDGKKLAYTVCKGFYQMGSLDFDPKCTAGEFVVTVDTESGETIEGTLYPRVEDLSFTPDNTKIVYRVCTESAGVYYQCEGTKFLVIGTAEVNKTYPYPVGLFALSGDGSHVAFTACKPTDAAIPSSCQEDEPQFIIFDGKEEKAYAWVSEPSISTDGKQLAYVACDSLVNGNCAKSFVVLNGIEGQAYDRILSAIFSPDSKMLVTTVIDGDKRYIILGDNKSQAYDMLTPYPIFAKDGKTIQYVGKLGNDFWKITQEL